MISTEASWWDILNLKIYTTLGYIFKINYNKVTRESIRSFKQNCPKNNSNDKASNAIKRSQNTPNSILYSLKHSAHDVCSPV